MARHYNLNDFVLEANEEGFLLKAPKQRNGTTPTVTGDFETPELIVCNYLRGDIIESYESQPGVTGALVRGVLDAISENPIAIETHFFLDSGINWFELDHSKFNEVYGIS